MSALYGRVQGNRGEATRTGTDRLTTSAETWNGSVRVDLRRDGSYVVSIGGKYGDGAYRLTGNVNDGIRSVFDPQGKTLYDQAEEAAYE